MPTPTLISTTQWWEEHRWMLSAVLITYQYGLFTKNPQPIHWGYRIYWHNKQQEFIWLAQRYLDFRSIYLSLVYTRSQELQLQLSSDYHKLEISQGVQIMRSKEAVFISRSLCTTVHISSSFSLAWYLTYSSGT